MPARPLRTAAPPDLEGAREIAHPGHHDAHDPGSAASVAQPVKIDNDLYVRDYSKCILCYKCVEACGDDFQNTFAISVAGRGFDARISTDFAVPLPRSACVYCGNCIAVCPTGALMFKSEHDHRQAGTWDEASQTQVETICGYCGVGCTTPPARPEQRDREGDLSLRSFRDARQSLHQGPLRLAIRAGPPHRK